MKFKYNGVNDGDIHLNDLDDSVSIGPGGLKVVDTAPQNMIISHSETKIFEIQDTDGVIASFSNSSRQLAQLVSSGRITVIEPPLTSATVVKAPFTPSKLENFPTNPSIETALNYLGNFAASLKNGSSESIVLAHGSNIGSTSNRIGKTFVDVIDVGSKMEFHSGDSEIMTVNQDGLVINKRLSVSGSFHLRSGNEDISNGILRSVGGEIVSDATTSDLDEGSNLYFTSSRARESISGISDQISFDPSTGEIGIDVDYVGQKSITTLGMITHGSWQASPIDPAHGGTGITSYLAGDMIYANDATTLSRLSRGAANQILGMDTMGIFPQYKSLEGTPDQVNVSYSDGMIKISTPQPIASTSSPSFYGLSLVSGLKLGFVPGHRVLFSVLGGNVAHNDGFTFNGTNLSLPASPTLPLHAATKQYVDSVASGLSVKPSVALATTQDMMLKGLLEVDGVVVKAGDRVLVKDQVDASKNGIYIVATGSWYRAPDVLANGAFVFVKKGNVNSNSGWTISSDGPIVVGTSSISFNQFSNSSPVVPGRGLTQIGSMININSAAATRITVSDNGIDLAAAGTPGSFTKVTTDQYGRVIAGSSLTSSDVLNALGFSPMNKLGDSFSGNLSVGDGLSHRSLAINGAAGSNRDAIFQSAGKSRWILRVDSTAESGDESGSNLLLMARRNTGAVLDIPVKIERKANGNVEIFRPTLITSTNGLTVTDGTNSTLKFSNDLAGNHIVSGSLVNGTRDLYFEDAKSGELMRLTSTGNLGIGGMPSNDKLLVHSNTASVNVMISSNSGDAKLTVSSKAGTSHFISFITSNPGRKAWNLGINEVDDSLRIGIGKLGLQDRLVIEQNGKTSLNSPVVEVNGLLSTGAPQTISESGNFIPTSSNIEITDGEVFSIAGSQSAGTILFISNISGAQVSIDTSSEEITLDHGKMLVLMKNSNNTWSQR